MPAELWLQKHLPRVNASGIAVPDIDQEVSDGLAVVDVHELEVEVQVDAGLALGDVLADQLARDKVRSNGDLGNEGALRVGSEDGVQGGIQIVAKVRGVVAKSAPLGESGLVTLGLDRL
jgi:hypothetical protein